jgi:hypothetical protein
MQGGQELRAKNLSGSLLSALALDFYFNESKLTAAL